MLAPPKDPKDNRLFRAWLWRQCDINPKRRAAILDRARNDIVFFTDSFAWQYNPRLRGEAVVGPFISWPFQEAALAKIAANIEADRDLILEKSREVGGTWQVLIPFVQRCCLLKYQNFLLVSHSEKAVNAPGDKNSLFYKIQFMVDHLPEWMKGDVAFKKNIIIFNSSKSDITGAATTQRAGVGGRVTAALLDEFGMQEDDRTIWGATADLGCRIVCSTHYKLSAKFYELCQTAHEDRRDKIIMHWSQHPQKCKGLYRSGVGAHGWEPIDKDYDYGPDFVPERTGRPTGGPTGPDGLYMFAGVRSPWYDAEVMRRGSLRDVALHLDIDVSGSQEQFADPLLIQGLIDRGCQEPFWTGTLDYGPDGRPNRLVEGKGPIRLWMHPDGGGQIAPGRYAFGIDVSMGQGATPTCMSGGNADTGEKIFEFSDANINPIDMAVLAVAVCWLFRTPGGQGARLCWECPGPGLDLGSRVLELGYGNYHQHEPEGRNVAIRSTGRPGWFSSPNAKSTLLRNYLSCLSTAQVINRSKSALKELLEFAFTKQGTIEHGNYDSPGKHAGARVAHGDMAIADALMVMMLRHLGIGRPDMATIIDSGPPQGSLAWRREYHRMRELDLGD